MKKALFILLLFTSIVSFSQEREKIDIEEKQNELKINATNLIIFKWADFGYERILNEESSVGVGLLFNIDSDRDDDDLDTYRTFSITPYYRHFFSRQYAEGFFVEGFTMLHSGVDDFYDYDSIVDSVSSYKEENYTDLAVGISAGFKAVSRRGFVAEIYAGIGRDLLGNSDLEVVGRGGISLGFRFN